MWRAVVTTALLLKSCPAELVCITALVHLGIKPLTTLQAADAFATAILLLGAAQQWRAWQRLRLHNSQNPRAAETPSTTSGKSPKELRVLTQNIWAHYLATPAQQFLECFSRQHARDGTATALNMNGLDFGGRFDALASRVQADGIDVVLVQEIFVLRCGLYIASGNFHALADKMAAVGLVCVCMHRELPAALL